ncbi:MAG: CHAT domain-containing protein [Bryobacterales bacterium]|nr:CHAT domain-containing protein [Bryobacterales bacterium]
MTRSPAFLLLLVLAGCAPRGVETADSLLVRAEELLRKDRRKEAQAVAEQAAALVGDRQIETAYQLRLLRAELLLLTGSGEDTSKQVRALLPETLPAGLRGGELEARLKMLWAAPQLARDSAESSRLLDEAYSLAGDSVDGRIVAQIDIRRSVLRIEEGKADEAKELLARAGRRARILGDAMLQAACEGNLAYLYLRGARYEEALPHLQEALALSEKAGAENSAVNARGNLGYLYLRLGEWERSEESLTQTVADCRRLGSQAMEQHWLGILGNLYQEQARRAEARRAYEQALVLAQKSGDRAGMGLWHNNLSLLAIERGEWDDAARHVAEAQRLLSHTGAADDEMFSLVSAARVAVGRGENEAARALLERVLRAPFQDPTPVLDARVIAAELAARTGDARGAEGHFRAALRLVEQRRAGLRADSNKLSYMAGGIRFYRSYVSFLMREGQPERALAVAEASRALLLAEKLNQGKARPSGGSDASHLRAVARAEGATLVSFWLAPERSFAWVVNAAGVQSFELLGEEVIRPIAREYLAFVERGRDPLDTENPSGRRLYDALLAPLREAIPANARVILEPDGILHSLNFESIPVPEPRRHYWIEDVTLSVTPALSLLEPERARAPWRGAPLLLMGAPAAVDEGFPALPFAAEEMRLVRGHFGGAGAVEYQAAGVTPASYLEASPERFRLIHFAAHATANPESPMDSAIVLAGTPPHHKLRARDIMQRPIAAEVVTISACRSAGVRAYAGEGLVGLTWAFLQAGARHVIAGLWEVNDQTTPRLMDHLYGGLAAGRTPADALRAAKLQMIRSGGRNAAPYYWAPFQLYSLR